MRVKTDEKLPRDVCGLSVPCGSDNTTLPRAGGRQCRSDSHFAGQNMEDYRPDSRNSMLRPTAQLPLLARQSRYSF